MATLELMSKILAALGRLEELDAEQARVEKTSLEARGLHTATDEDLERIQTLVDESKASRAQEATADGAPASTASPVRTATPTAPAPRPSLDGQPWSLEQDFGPFIQGLQGGMALVDRVEALLDATDFDDVVRRATELFVDELGYDVSTADETGRVGRSEFREVRRIAQHDEFFVVVTELTSSSHYASFYDALYRLHPYGLVISVEPDAGCLRFVSRENVGSSLYYQTGRGFGMSWQVHDDLVVLAGRVNRMRPRFTDDAIVLQRRVHEAVTASYGELAKAWTSNDLPVDEDLPGIAWDEVLERGIRSFLQQGRQGAQLRRWGLEAVFRDLFPMGVARGQFKLRYRGHEAPRIEPGPEPQARITLHLRLEGQGIEEDLDREVCVPLPTADGLIRGGGVSLVFAPSETAATAWDFDEDDDEAVEDVVAALEVDDSDGEASDEPDPETPWFAGPSDEQRASVEPSWSFEFRLRYAARRQLLRMRRRLWFASGLDDGVKSLQLLLQRFGDPMPLLAPPDWYLAGLARASDGASSRLHAIRTGGLPPSWACLDVSSALAPGHYVPVGIARLHPCGALTIPASLGSDRVRLETSEQTACVLNPRAGGTGGGPDVWWIASLARRWAARPPSPFPDPLALLDSRSIPACFAVAIPNERLSCAMAPDLKRRLGWYDEILEQRIPDLTGKAPSLAVAEGDVLEPEDVWLRVPASEWPGARAVGACAEERLAHDILQTTPADATFELRVPPGLGGVVVQATVERVQPDTDPGFVARVVVRRKVAALGQVLLPDGRLAPVEGELMPWDAPYDTSGRRADLVVHDPRARGDQIFFDGISDEEALAGTTLPSELLTWLPPESPDLALGPDRHLRFRLLDGEGVPSHRRSPTISEAERDCWAALDPDTYAELVAAERALNASVPPWMPALFRTLTAAATKPAREMPPAWPNPAMRPRAEAANLGDPMRTQVKAIAATSGDSDPSSVVAWCEPDGRAVGPAHAKEGRPEGRHVDLQLRDLRHDVLPALSLRVPVLHPWKRAVAAALLGLDIEELNALVLQFGPTDVLEVCRRASEHPWAALRRRLEAATKDRRSGLQRVAWHLERELAAYGEPRLELDHVPVPAPELLSQGVPPGAPGLLGSPLMVASRCVVQANDALGTLDLNSPRIARLAEVALQRGVERLFGTSEPSVAEMGPRTLAGYARQHWPLTRPRTQRSASPLLGYLAGELVEETVRGAHRVEVRVLRDVAVRAYVVPSPTSSRRPTCWTTDGPRPLLSPKREVVAALDDERWWRVRAARAWVLDDHVPFFAGLFDAASRLSADVDARRCLHRFVMDLVFRRADPTALVEVLTRPLPLRLPNDESKARAQVTEIVAPGVGDLAVRAALCEVLSSFWSTAPDGTSLGGWHCSAFDGPPPPHATRAIPHRGSPAWLRIPAVAAIDEPIRHLLDGRAAPELPETLRSRLGLAVRPFGVVEEPSIEEAMPALHQTAPPPAPTRETTAPADEVSPVSDVEDIRPLELPFATWLHPPTSP